MVTRPPAINKLLETEGDTHTHTHGKSLLFHPATPNKRVVLWDLENVNDMDEIMT